MYKEVISFIRGKFNEPEKFIPLHIPTFNGNEKKYVNECIDSTFVSSVGKFVNQFERKVAEFTGAKYAIASVNGTAALHIALILSDVNQDDEVITQPLTFVATTNAISYTGAKPIFIDVDKDTMGLSPKSLRDWLEGNVEKRTVEESNTKHLKSFNKTTGKQVKACIPMHTFGHPCRIDEIKEICDDYNITLIEDAAESLGSYYKEKHTGTFGKFGFLSFNGNKTITSGGGGMILTDDEELAKKAKHITTTAKVPHDWNYIHDMIGYNYRLTNIAAAIGVAQMEQLPDFLIRKRKLAKEYSTFFSKTDFKFVEENKNTKVNYWLNAIILKNRKQRDEFLKYFNDNKIMTRPIWELMTRLEMFKDCQVGALPNAEWLSDRVVNIPSSVIYN